MVQLNPFLKCSNNSVLRVADIALHFVWAEGAAVPNSCTVFEDVASRHRLFDVNVPTIDEIRF